MQNGDFGATNHKLQNGSANALTSQNSMKSSDATPGSTTPVNENDNTGFGLAAWSYSGNNKVVSYCFIDISWKFFPVFHILQILMTNEVVGC